jgi:hypothetical protein
MSALARSYTPGVLTAPIIVIPFSLWAWRTLEQAGAVSAGASNLFIALALLPMVILGTHILAAAILSTLRASSPALSSVPFYSYTAAGDPISNDVRLLSIAITVRFDVNIPLA